MLGVAGFIVSVLLLVPRRQYIFYFDNRTRFFSYFQSSTLPSHILKKSLANSQICFLLVSAVHNHMCCYMAQLPAAHASIWNSCIFDVGLFASLHVLDRFEGVCESVFMRTSLCVCCSCGCEPNWSGVTACPDTQAATKHWHRFVFVRLFVCFGSRHNCCSNSIFMHLK